MASYLGCATSVAISVKFWRRAPFAWSPKKEPSDGFEVLSPTLQGILPLEELRERAAQLVETHRVTPGRSYARLRWRLDDNEKLLLRRRIWVASGSGNRFAVYPSHAEFKLIERR